MNKTKVTKFSHWMAAFRFRTLFLSFSCIGTGLASASLFNEIDNAVATFTLLTALFLQVLSNLANDYGDSIHGADNADRKGPKRAVQAGVISAQQMKMAVIVSSVLSLIAGITLLILAFPIIGLTAIITLFMSGLLAIAAAILYTNGKRPYGYAGLGDISVFLFFGLLAVLGSAFLQTGSFNSELLEPAIAFGFLAVGVLNVNNMRDIHSDQIAGKLSIPVRIGLQLAKLYHYVLVLLAILLMVHFMETHDLNLVLLILPISALLFHLFKIYRSITEEQFDPQLKVLSLSSFLLCLSFILSIIYST
ncbi:MAG: 1,4-dihydroxy-2-naphthoate octaprenyltransferase [Bacteroidia bacterium]